MQTEENKETAGLLHMQDAPPFKEARIHIRRLYMLLPLCLMAFLMAIVAADTQATTIDEITDDGLAYTLISQKGARPYGDTLVIDRISVEGERQRIYHKDFNGLKPWKLGIADVDGDRKKELLIAVRKTTHFDPLEKNRMFIFQYDGEKLYKKWTGSQIAGVWNDFYAGNLLPIPGDELIFIEQVSGDEERISIYYWFDFGFVFLAASERYPDIKNISIRGENRLSITTAAEGQNQSRTLMVKSGKIIELIPNP
ncbi:hypothetical protein [Brevibacillus migulae]|uniref:hypothetical protein n=1 Tax=Brevibacillus migulae TaxID=1644114 RepID=UPI00106E6EDD|nr:hypothetical protein [Brevibacillus migulae]